MSTFTVPKPLTERITEARLLARQHRANGDEKSAALADERVNRLLDLWSARAHA
jgi:hypothetical protein